MSDQEAVMEARIDRAYTDLQIELFGFTCHKESRHELIQIGEQCNECIPLYRHKATEA